MIQREITLCSNSLKIGLAQECSKNRAWINQLFFLQHLCLLCTALFSAMSRNASYYMYNLKYNLCICLWHLCVLYNRRYKQKLSNTVFVFIIFYHWYVCLCAQYHLTFCNSMDCSPSGSSVHGIFWTRILKQVVIS